MYHAACKVEFQPFNRSYSQLADFNLRVIKYQCTEWLWKMVLLTLAASRGVTDLSIYFIRIKHKENCVLTIIS